MKSAWKGRDKILRIAFRIGDECIPELEVFASKDSENSLIFDVDELGHITGLDLLKDILSIHGLGYTHDIVSPYEEPLSSAFSDWDDDGWEE